MILLHSGVADHELPRHGIEIVRWIEVIEESAESAILRPFFDRAMRKSQ